MLDWLFSGCTPTKHFVVVEVLGRACETNDTSNFFEHYHHRQDNKVDSTEDMTKKAVVSGVLPRTRHILPVRKTFWELEAEKKAPVGFKDPEMIPKNVVAKWTPKHEKDASERIAHSAKAPIKPRKETSEEQKWRNLTADVRRSYFKDTLKTQEARDIKAIERREAAFRKAKDARLAIDQSKESEATRLTLPTIDSFLEGSFIKKRTPEEVEELKLKREANRVYHEIKHKQQKAAQVLEIYQNSQGYIIDEEGLDQAIQRAFTTYDPTKSITITDQTKLSRDVLAQHLLGLTSNNQPGLPRVEDALAGTGSAVTEGKAAAAPSTESSQPQQS